MMEKLDSTSLDLTKVNIEKLKELFPNAVTEGKIDFDVLRTLLGDEVDDSKEKYQFTWPGKSEAIKLAQSPSSSTLRPVKESSKQWEETKNLYIEGDNLEVLKQLQKTYYGKVKMIYIDPPYNTGSDFIYKDDRKDSLKNYKNQTEQGMSSNPETNGRFHSEWLNLIYPRLILSKNLLRDDGVLFISIDDHEIENLIKICKEVFGESNYIQTLKWKRKKQPSFLSKHVAPMMEYIAVVAKNSNKLKKLSIEKVSDETKKVINISNSESERYLNPGVLVKGIESGIISKGEYVNKTMSVSFLDDVCVSGGLTTNKIRVHAKFLNTQDKINEFISEGLLFITENKGLRRYLSLEEKDKEKSITDLLLDWGDNQDSDKEFINLFSKKLFDYVKPTKLITNLIKSCSSENDIIMDFFAGSSTTAHSVFLQNIEDSSNRRFILVQFPEKIEENSEAFKLGYRNICDIGKERIRRAGAQLKAEWENKNQETGLFSECETFSCDTGFKVFRLDSTNIQPWDNETKIEEHSLFNLSDVFKNDRTKEDILYEIMLKYGVFDMPVTEIYINGKTMYKVGKRYMIVCLEDAVTSNDITEIAALKPKTVVFKESGFLNDNDKINAVYNLEKTGVEDVKCI